MPSVLNVGVALQGTVFSKYTDLPAGKKKTYIKFAELKYDIFNYTILKKYKTLFPFYIA